MIFWTVLRSLTWEIRLKPFQPQNEEKSINNQPKIIGFYCFKKLSYKLFRFSQTFHERFCLNFTSILSSVIEKLIWVSCKKLSLVDYNLVSYTENDF